MAGNLTDIFLATCRAGAPRRGTVAVLAVAKYAAARIRLAQYHGVIGQARDRPLVDGYQFAVGTLARESAEASDAAARHARLARHHG